MIRRALLLCACLACASAAEAQAPSASESAAARALFQEGLEHVEAQRWREALEAFQRSYALVPRPSTLLNIASAQSELGLYVEAAESYRAFLAAAEGRAARYRDDAEEALRALEPHIAHVTLRIPALEPGDELRLDGRALPLAALDVPLPMNPGSHRLTVQRDGAEVGSVNLTLVEGEQREVEMALRPPAPALATAPAPPPREDLLESPWLWAGVGAGVAVVVAIVIGAAVASSSGVYVGNLGPGRVTF